MQKAFIFNYHMNTAHLAPEFMMPLDKNYHFLGGNHEFTTIALNEYPVI